MKKKENYNSIFQTKFQEISGLIREDPNNEELYQKLGILYLKYKEHESAESAYTKALKINPENPWTYLYFGNLYFAKNEFGKAVEWFTKAINRIPDNPCPYWCLAEVYEKLGRWYLADKYFQKAVDVDPGDFEANKKLEDWIDRNTPIYK